MGTLEQLDELVMAIDAYSRESAKKQRHLLGRWGLVVARYAKFVGISNEEAEQRLNALIQ
jgi:hypothetical protein